MKKIRRLSFMDTNKIKKMVEYVKPELISTFPFQKSISVSPFDLIHGLLPVNIKFLEENYVAVEKKKLFGSISLIRDNCSGSRWKINRLILDSSSYDTGKLLIDYVVNKYGGEGVESFITIIEDKNTDAVVLFKNACGFRSCTQVQIFKKENISPSQNSDPLFLRAIKPSDAKYVQEFESNALFPQFRTSLKKSEKDFKFGIKSEIIDKFKGRIIKRLVVENPSKNLIEGYVVVTTEDNKNYFADIILSMPYQDYYEDILASVEKYVSYCNKDATLYVFLKKYYQTGKKLNEILLNSGFNLHTSYEMLVKDYWKPMKVLSVDKKSPVIILPDSASPAFNKLD